MTTLGLLPLPTSLTALPGQPITIPDAARVAVAARLLPAVRVWQQDVAGSFGAWLNVFVAPASSADADVDVVFEVDASLPASGYRLEIGPAATPGARNASAAAESASVHEGAGSKPAIHVRCADLPGAYAAIATLTQLAGPQAFRKAPTPGATLSLPRCVIEDAPRFEWRGLLIDPARNFRTKAEVLRYIDLAAAHKINVIQLHLTDDQGWRFEVDAYPRLVEVASWRKRTTISKRNTGFTDPRPHGGYYTRADLREISAYGKAHGVLVVPEIDVPGHSQAAITAYPELGAVENVAREVWTTWGISKDVLDPAPATVEFYRTVLDQVMEDFDSPYIHIGGDEQPMDAWWANPDIVAQAAHLGYRKADGTGDVTKLHGWFLNQLIAHLKAGGRRAIVWDEAFGPELPRDVIVDVWREADTAAQVLAAGHDVILAWVLRLYFDYPQQLAPTEPWLFQNKVSLADVYGYEPVVTPEQVAAAGLTCQSGQTDLPGQASQPAEASEPGPTNQPEAAGPPKPGRIIGIQAQLWSEHMDSITQMDYMAFPRLGAFAEVAWRQGLPASRGEDTEAWQTFTARVAQDYLPMLDAAGVAYRPLSGPKPWQRHPDPAAAARNAGWVDESVS